MIKKFMLAWLLFLVNAAWLCAFTYYSPTVRTEYLPLPAGDSLLVLREHPIIGQTDSVTADSLLLTRGTDYLINNQTGTLYFIPSTVDRLCEIRYSIYPPNILQKFFVYEKISLNDSLRVEAIKKRRTTTLSGEKLTISGSKTISLSVANDEGVSISQSMYLKMDGELSPNMKVEAQLSDSQSPITPEGDSRELSALDQVFIRLYGRQYEIAFGDLELNFTGTRFLNYNAKFEGLKAGYHDQQDVQAAFAISKGKRTENRFYGVEGKQGPYYLTATNSQLGIKVVPGSETVYLDGAQIQRGTDYTIDYSEGTITFKTLITSNSSIRVSFLYTDEYYRQTLAMNAAQWRLSDSITAGHHIILQADDKKNPIDQVFTDTDIHALQNAGDHPAYGQGIYHVERGKGQYVAVPIPDTLASLPDTTAIERTMIFVYVGADSTGDYILYFSYVGDNQGDYAQIAPQQYRWVGAKKGDWIIGKTLQTPTSKVNYDAHLSVIHAGWELRLEGLLSDEDRNTYSSLDDNNNLGFIGQADVIVKPDWDKIKPQLTSYFRKKTSHLATFADITDPDEAYDLAQFTQTDSLGSIEAGCTFGFTLFQKLLPQIRYRFKDATSAFLERDLIISNTLRQIGLSPEIYGRYLHAAQLPKKDEGTEYFIERSELREQHTFKHTNFGTSWQTNLFRNTFASGHESGTRYGKYSAFFRLKEYAVYSAQASYNTDENETLTHSDLWQTTRASDTWQLNQLAAFKQHTMRLDYTHRIIRSQVESESDQKYDLAEFHSSHNLWNNALSGNTTYTLNNLEFYPKVRQLHFVGNGLGYYDSLGVYQNQGDYDYEIVNVGTPELSTEIHAEANVFLNPAQYPGIDLTQPITRIQSESYAQVSENSRSPKKIPVYLLNPDYLMSERYTIYGKQSYRQTLWFDLIRKKANLKLLYEKNKSLDNRYLEYTWNQTDSWESSLQWNRWLRSDWEFSGEYQHDTDSHYQSDIHAGTGSIVIRQHQTNQLILESDVSATSERGNQVGSISDYRLISLSFKESVTWFMKQNYRTFGRMEIRRNQRTGSSYLGFLPEKRNGYIATWLFQMNYKVNSFTSAVLEYSGNSYPKQQTIHKAMMEIKAEF